MLERLGKYEILETIAAGGQGTVYRARDSGSGDVVALEVMHPGHTGEVQYLEALRQEANLASRLDHPNIVKVFDFQVEGGTAYVAMEYVPGVLRGEMQPGTPISPGRAVELAIQVCGAVAHAHQHGVVHRDIKPQNILVKPIAEAAVLALEGQDGAGVLNRGLDLQPVADDTGVVSQRLHLGRPKAGHGAYAPVVERRSESVSLVQNHAPGQPGLEHLQAHYLEQEIVVEPLAQMVLTYQSRNGSGGASGS